MLVWLVKNWFKVFQFLFQFLSQLPGTKVEVFYPIAIKVFQLYYRNLFRLLPGDLWERREIKVDGKWVRTEDLELYIAFITWFKDAELYHLINSATKKPLVLRELLGEPSGRNNHLILFAWFKDYMRYAAGKFVPIGFVKEPKIGTAFYSYKEYCQLNKHIPLGTKTRFC